MTKLNHWYKDFVTLFPTITLYKTVSMDRVGWKSRIKVIVMLFSVRISFERQQQSSTWTWKLYRNEYEYVCWCQTMPCHRCILQEAAAVRTELFKTELSSGPAICSLMNIRSSGRVNPWRSMTSSRPLTLTRWSNIWTEAISCCRNQTCL